MLDGFERKQRLAPALGQLQPRIHFLAALMIDDKERAILHVHAAVIDIERMLLGAEFIFEEAVQLLRPLHLHPLGDHHRPGKDGEEQQEDDDDLRFERGLSPDVRQIHALGLCGG